MTDTTIVTCADCGQRNRVLRVVPPGKAAICGRCKEPLGDLDDDDLDELEDLVDDDLLDVEED
jgi:uncharacterized paraquat-inducible protein A